MNDCSDMVDGEKLRDVEAKNDSCNELDKGAPLTASDRSLLFALRHANDDGYALSVESRLPARWDESD